jgi:glycosyltransferase involved in cell wall biosynthesis
MRISVGIPLYNEERLIPELLRRVREVLDKVPGGPHELILVDDGSSDGTFASISEAATRDDFSIS